MSADPLLAALPGLDEAIGDNLNLYAYAGNNPIGRIDLTGFEGTSLDKANSVANRIWSAGRQMFGAAKNAAASAADKVEKEANKPRNIGGGRTAAYAPYAKTIGNETINETGAAVLVKVAGGKVPNFQVTSGGPKDVSVKAGKVAHILGGAAITAGLGASANAARASSARLAKALENAKVTRSEGTAAHHIVAGGAARAAPARAVLQRFGIPINNAANGVFLPATRASPNATGAAVHSTLHTKAYYDAVNEALSVATNRQEALQILQVLGNRLLAGGL